MKRALVAAILPVVCVWARRHEALILRRGDPLDEDALRDARRVGVLRPERVRTLLVHSVPPRLPAFLRTLVKRFRWGPATVTGMALGYGIFVRADERDNRCLLIHELAHCAQSEQMGFRPFLEQYVHECLTAGYPDGRLEAEAKQIARDFI